MPDYEVLVTKKAEKQIKKMERKLQKKVINTLDSLTTIPRPAGVEKLRENPQIYRLRIADFRLLYTIKDDELKVIAIEVRDRKDAYKNLKNIDVKAIVEQVMASSERRGD